MEFIKGESLEVSPQVESLMTHFKSISRGVKNFIVL